MRLPLALIVFVSLMAALGAGVLRNLFIQPGPLTQPTSVVIAAGQGTSAIATQLHQSGVIAHPQAFRIAVKLMGLGSTLKAGEYQFQPALSLRSVINKLALGDTQSRSLTIPEGYTVKQILQTITKAEGLTGTANAVPEGSLFPDTYSFTLGTDREKIIQIMTERMTKELNEAWNARQQGFPLQNPDELLNLASIVQKEAANEAEMPTIAAVFLNRLRQNMLLQADPTVIYGADYDGNIRRKDLTEPHPFNTYIHKGLPPTPISNPGRAALQATANPASVPYLFFVANPSRTEHVFSTTYAEHQRHVQSYLKATKNAK